MFTHIITHLIHHEAAGKTHWRDTFPSGGMMSRSATLPATGLQAPILINYGYVSKLFAWTSKKHFCSSGSSQRQLPPRGTFTDKILILLTVTSKTLQRLPMWQVECGKGRVEGEGARGRAEELTGEESNLSWGKKLQNHNKVRGEVEP